jgi:hypothetical protein
MHWEKLMYTTYFTLLILRYPTSDLPFAGELETGGVICIGLQRATVFSFSRNET